MGSHPLDISGILIDKGIELTKKYPPKEKIKESVEKPQAESERRGVETPRIKSEFWSQLNLESRKILCSRAWKHVDFNVMLQELNDLTKLTEKWLRWAIPSFVNGRESGPIKDWLDGKNRENDFHYVLVGEHLRYFQEVRKQKKLEKEALVNETQDSTLVEELSGKDEALEGAINELTTHIDWFQNYIEKRNEQTQQPSA